MHCVQGCNNGVHGGEASHRQRQQLLENSCVTFQYYNSNQFASNSTNMDGGRQSNAYNCFYITKTTNNMDSKDGGS